MRSSPSLPYFAQVGVIALVPDEWEVPWQLRHQILTRLSRYFNVLWCTPPRWWRHWWHHDPAPQYGYFNNGSTLAPGFAIYRPESYLPVVGRPRFLAQWIERERLRRARQMLLARGCRQTILYLWRPEYASALDLINHELSCYHIDDEYTFSEIEQPLDPEEARLITRVDQVFVHSPALLEKKGKLNPHTLFVPNGVDYQAYATPQPEPRDLIPIPHPRVGYVGRIKEQLDWPLLVDLAKRHRQWSFVMVGPRDNFNSKLSLLQKFSQLPNVYFLGAKPVSALPAYSQHLDVGMLCYALSDYTKFIYPLKLHEYLATGRPVVGSPIRTLQEFSHVVRLAQTTDEWSNALTGALSVSACTAAQVKARQSVAHRHEWDGLVRIIAGTMGNALGLHIPEPITPVAIS